jgi:hypothetical protein
MNVENPMDPVDPAAIEKVLPFVSWPIGGSTGSIEPRKTALVVGRLVPLKNAAIEANK